MELLAKQIMQVKDMCLKNEKFIYLSIVIIFFLFSCNVNSATQDKKSVVDYLSSLKYFSASFIQDDGENLSEGKFYIGDKRVRAEYFSPTKILIILDDNKAMYYNYELEEDEFFNPKNTNAWFFYDIFRNPIFFEDGLIRVRGNELVLEKEGANNKEESFLIRVIFEKNPLVLWGVEVVINEEVLKLSIYDHSFYEDFDESFFKLINPKLLN